MSAMRKGTEGAEAVGRVLAGEGSYHSKQAGLESFEMGICIKGKLSGLVKYSSKYAKEWSY